MYPAPTARRFTRPSTRRLPNGMTAFAEHDGRCLVPREYIYRAVADAKARDLGRAWVVIAIGESWFVVTRQSYIEDLRRRDAGHDAPAMER